MPPTLLWKLLLALALALVARETLAFAAIAIGYRRSGSPLRWRDALAPLVRTWLLAGLVAAVAVERIAALP